MAEGTQSHDRQASFPRLQADIGAVEMEPQRGVELQTGIPANDQQQLVERRDPGGQLGAIAQLSAAIDNPADSFCTERLGGFQWRDHLSDPINPRDTDWPELPFGLLDLLKQASVPTVRQINILVHANDPLVPGPRQSHDQPGGGAGRLVNQDDLVGRTRPS